MGGLQSVLEGRQGMRNCDLNFAGPCDYLCGVGFCKLKLNDEEKIRLFCLNFIWNYLLRERLVIARGEILFDRLIFIVVHRQEFYSF